MPLICQSGIQAPEYLDNTQCRLRNRLGNIAARRGNRPDGSQCADSVFTAQAYHAPRTLVELCQTGAQISRVALLSRHLLQTTGHLAQRLRPARGGVCHQRNAVAHIAEEFRNRNSCINRCLSCRNGHIGGVRNQNGSLHQRFSRAGILQLRELVQYVRHFVPTLTAADVNHNIRIRPFCQLMLCDCLAGAEGAGNCRNAALCNGEKGVNDTLPRNQRCIRRFLLLIRSFPTNRPFLHHAHRNIVPLLVGNDANRFLYCKIPEKNILHHTLQAVGNHDFALYHRRFLYKPNLVARSHGISRLYGRLKFPFLFSVQRRNL